MIHQLDFKTLRKNLRNNVEKLPTIKIALLGDASTQFIHTALKGFGIQMNVHFDIYEAGYDMIEQEILNPDSELYHFSPELIILIPSTEKLLQKFYGLENVDRRGLAVQVAGGYQEKIRLLNEKLTSKIILFNYPIINTSVFGHFSNKNNNSFTYQLRCLNILLMDFAINHGNLYIFDLAIIQSTYGRQKVFDPKLFTKTKMVLSLEILPIVAKELTDIILSIKGIKLNKCLILDLDNTLWGGVIGDDGIEGIQVGNLGIGRAFTELQLWCKELQKRGIILCVCSKNTESIAKEPFEKHPEMILRLADISVFVANWENKADNIRHIQNVLNIGYDSMVFLDDNPFERNIVRQELPKITVPEMPEDPVEYIGYLQNLNLFETASVSREDKNRTKRYQEEAKRSAVKTSFKSIEAYLKDLGMIATDGNFSEFTIPRVAQLTQRSNQFNLRTIRYSEQEIKKIHQDNNCLTYQLKLKDKFGEYGLISIVIGRIKQDQLFLDTWIMSCRVLKRDVEKYVLNQLVTRCEQVRIRTIVGEWIPTPKNKIVEKHYENLGFQEKEGLWFLDVDAYIPLKCHISNKN